MSCSGTTLAPNPWLRILDALEKKINRHSYDTWLKPTRYSHSSNGIMYVRVPTVEFRHVGDKYADLIQEALDNLGMEYQDVEFVTPTMIPRRLQSATMADFPCTPRLPPLSTSRKRASIGTAPRN